MPRIAVTVNIDQSFRTEECVTCGVAFAMTETFYSARQRNKDAFYCPSGHSQHYLGRTHEAVLREAQERVRELEDMKDRNARRIQALTTQNANLRRKNAMPKKPSKK